MTSRFVGFTNDVLRVRHLKSHARIAGPKDPPCLPVFIALGVVSVAAVLDRCLSTSLHSREMCQQSRGLALSVRKPSIKA